MFNLNVSKNILTDFRLELFFVCNDLLYILIYTILYFLPSQLATYNSDLLTNTIQHEERITVMYKTPEINWLL